jgi:hypothetical protein
MPENRTYTDRDGRPIPYDVWLSKRDRESYRAVARDATGELSILTDWLGETPGRDGSSRMFSTQIVDRSKYYHVKLHGYYATEDEARRGHLECVREIRRRRRKDALHNVVAPIAMVLVLAGISLWLVGWLAR